MSVAPLQRRKRAGQVKGDTMDARRLPMWQGAGLPRVAIAGLVALLIVESVVRLPAYASVWLGNDYRLYMDATREWLTTGSFYHPYQLAGPYAVYAQEILYPPVALWLFVPFTVLPTILWWSPVLIVAWVVWKQRPTPWQWVAILALLAFPIEDGTSWAIEFVGNGNPGMWAAAFVALATRWPVFGSFTLVKPSLLPFALFGIRSRAWWLGVAVLAVLSVPFGAMWLDYAVVVLNAQGAGILYSLPNVTLCLVPLAARLSADRRRGALNLRDTHERGGLGTDPTGAGT